jgi:hypothetical protein
MQTIEQKIQDIAALLGGNWHYDGTDKYRPDRHFSISDDQGRTLCFLLENSAFHIYGMPPKGANSHYESKAVKIPVSKSADMIATQLKRGFLRRYIGLYDEAKKSHEDYLAEYGTPESIAKLIAKRVGGKVQKILYAGKYEYAIHFAKGMAYVHGDRRVSLELLALSPYKAVQLARLASFQEPPFD